MLPVWIEMCIWMWKHCCIDDICCDYNHEGTPECYRSGLRCASGCGNSATNCRSGNCYDPGCSAVGMKYGYIAAQDYWGCIDPNLGENGMACLYRSDYAPAECNYNKTICGRQCNYDGTECGSVYMKECMTGGECLQDGTIINNCTCSGQITTINSISYCCPEGHTFINGGCTLIDCPDGQVADEGGICQTACKNNAEVLNCVCPGTTHTNQFNAKICCESGYTWNENTQTCQ